MRLVMATGLSEDDKDLVLHIGLYMGNEDLSRLSTNARWPLEDLVKWPRRKTDEIATVGAMFCFGVSERFTAETGDPIQVAVADQISTIMTVIQETAKLKRTGMKRADVAEVLARQLGGETAVGLN